MTSEQLKRFKEFTGKEAIMGQKEGEFLTDRPFNDSQYQYSPWLVSYFYDESNGYLVCSMSHRMTNERYRGWDSLGNELDHSIVRSYFNPTDTFRVIKND